MAKQSPAFDVLINGKMKEATNGEAEFEDVSEETFVRFCQFAYTGDYATPAFGCTKPNPSEDLVSDNRSKSPPPAADTTELVIEETADPAPRMTLPTAGNFPPSVVEDQLDDWNGWSTPGKKSKSKTISAPCAFKTEFESKDYDFITFHSDLTSPCQIRKNRDRDEDYTPVFLGHARLYVFAEKWGIQGLKTLVLHKLHRTLVTFTLYKQRRSDIVELIKFVFSNNHTADLENEVEPLRELVTKYATCELGNLILAPEFLALLQQPGFFARDLVMMMMMRAGETITHGI